MCPRTATTSPMASTASPQSTKAARGAGAGKSRIAARERKNPAGMTSSPAYFMAFTFHHSEDGDRSAEFPDFLPGVQSMDLRCSDRCPLERKGLETDGNQMKCL